MNYRYLTLAIAFLALPLFSYAQKFNSEADYMKSTYGKDKKAMVADFLKLSPEEEKIFWPIYDSYEEKRATLGTERFQILETYMDNFESINDAMANEWMNYIFNYQDRYTKLLRDYYKRVAYDMTEVRGLQFYQIETFFDAEIRAMIYEEVPFVGE